MLEQHYLTTLFEPKSVAVIGASDRENAVGAVIFKNILSSGYKGRLYAINPKHETIQGQQAYKSIEEIGARVEMAVIATRPQTVPQIIEQCGRSGVRNVIIIAAGFSESGHIGAALERKVLEIARSYNVRILGPNCLGIIRPDLGLNATFARMTANGGNLALVSQSGAMCSAVLDWAKSNQVGFSSVISLGMTSDIDFGEILDYLIYDNRTHYILMYVEGIRNARRFMSALRSAARIKPIILLKAGRHEAGSHGDRRPLRHVGGLRLRIRCRRAPRRRRSRAEHRPAVLCRQGARLQVPPARQPSGDHHQRRRAGRDGGRPRRRPRHSAGHAVRRDDGRAQQGAADQLVARATRSTSPATRRRNVTATRSSPSPTTRTWTARWSCSRRRR